MRRISAYLLTLRYSVSYLLVLAGVLIALQAGSFAATSAGTVDESQTCVILTGLGGMPEYEENFLKWGAALEKVCATEIGAELHRMDCAEKRRTDFLELFDSLAAQPSVGPVWLFLIGHGSHDGRDYKFNVKGPDIKGADLESALNGLGDRRVMVVLATSSSGGLLPRLGGPRRVVVSATKSESERRPPLFISFFIEGATSAEADVNKDGRVSLREAFDFSESKVGAWYEEKGRLQTEHPLIADGEGAASLAQFAYLSSPPEQAYRSLEARNLAPERTRLEREIEDLKLRKVDLPAADYYRELERLLVELAELNERIRELEGSP